jgi:hypothetical protein
MEHLLSVEIHVLNWREDKVPGMEQHLVTQYTTCMEINRMKSYIQATGCPSDPLSPLLF